jgi:hypothetical protein
VETPASTQVVTASLASGQTRTVDTGNVDSTVTGRLAVSGDHAVLAEASSTSFFFFVIDLINGEVTRYQGGNLDALINGTHVAWLEGICNGTTASLPNDPSCTGSFNWTVRLLDLQTGTATAPLVGSSTRIGMWAANAPGSLAPVLAIGDDAIVTVHEDPADLSAWSVQANDFDGHVIWSLPRRGPIDHLQVAGSTVVWHELGNVGPGDSSQVGSPPRGYYVMFNGGTRPLYLGDALGAWPAPSWALVQRSDSGPISHSDFVVRPGHSPVLLNHQEASPDALSGRFATWLSNDLKTAIAYNVQTGSQTVIELGANEGLAADDSWLVWMGGPDAGDVSWTPMPALATGGTSP